MTKLLEYSVRSEPIFIIKVKNGRAYITPPGKQGGELTDVIVVEGFDVAIQADENTISISRISGGSKIKVLP